MSGPLAGRAVLVTRAPEQAGELIRLLEEAGASVVVLPTVAFFPPADPAPFEAAIARLSGYGWVAFTSANAVHAFFERLGGPDHLGRVRLAAVGPRTGDAISHWGAPVGLTAARGNAASLADGLCRLCRPGERILYPRAERVSDDLVGRLRSQGLTVDDPVAYRTAPPAADSFAAAGCLQEGSIHWITVMSGSALRHLHAMLPEPRCIRSARLATIGPRTSAEAASMGLEVHAEAREPTAAGLVAAIVLSEARR